MIKSGIDQDALVKMFAEATAKQSETLGSAVREATLKALQERELTLENIRKVLKTVTQAASTGTAQNPAGSMDVEQLLGKAFAGMDAALLQTVEAQRKALAQFVNQGVDVQDKHMKSALANLEQMENVFFTTVSRATRETGDSLRAPWQHVLDAMKLKGTDTGAQASVSVEQLLAQAQAALRDGRANGVHAARAMMDSYAALVSGVLIGMSDALQPEAVPDSGRSRKTQAQA
ncbi:DUF6781 family protein [Caballeronia sordidicola]|uniref:Uncharacterized protein n=1 Tax=Caballeronia sordidicola TaxID=196367 RepID=A0A226X708_CABSO|nr:DUF6781 family protein [Caballeronia sordidicola]OXC79242.1 hypothetical protein BSU04_08710 [Caballeronia sordidicola]